MNDARLWPILWLPSAAMSCYALHAFAVSSLDKLACF